jgi:hypothetical protein
MAYKNNENNLNGDGIFNAEKSVEELLFNFIYEKMFPVYEIYRKTPKAFSSSECLLKPFRKLRQYAGYSVNQESDLERQALVPNNESLTKGKIDNFIPYKGGYYGVGAVAFISSLISGGTAYVYKDSGADAKEWLRDAFGPTQDLIQWSPSIANGLLALVFSAVVGGGFLKKMSTTEAKLTNKKSQIGAGTVISCMLGSVFNLFPNVSLSYHTIRHHDATTDAPLFVGAAFNMLPGSIGIFNAGKYVYNHAGAAWRTICGKVKERTAFELGRECLIRHLEQEYHLLSITSSAKVNPMMQSFMLELKAMQDKSSDEGLANLLHSMLVINNNQDNDPQITVHEARSSLGNAGYIVPAVLTVWTIMKMYFTFAETRSSGKALASNAGEGVGEFVGILFGVFNTIAATGLAIPSIETLTSKVNNILFCKTDEFMFEEFKNNPFICVLAIGIAGFFGFFSGATTADLVRHNIDGPYKTVIFAVLGGLNSGLMINAYYMSQLFFRFIRAYQQSGWAPQKTQLQTNFLIAYREILTIIRQMTDDQYRTLVNSGSVQATINKLYDTYNTDNNSPYCGKLNQFATNSEEIC